MDRKLIITCEHAGNDVPSEYQSLFHTNSEVLNTHRGYDIGALELTNTLSSILNTKAHVHSISRLVIDLNRSLHNFSVFSEFMVGIDKQSRKSIIEEYYFPYRQRVQQLINESITKGQPVLHVSIHTFAPELKEVIRNADVGFLYDPRRSSEKDFCWKWRRQLKGQLPGLKYRMNYPYRGTMDGFTTHLRKELTQDEYWGVELEVNQKLIESVDKKNWQNIREGIALSLKTVLSQP